MTEQMTGPRMGFVGVTTGGSSIMRVFPEWAKILELPTQRLEGHDVALNADPQVYRDLVTLIADDPERLGALVTTHKMALYSAARELFDELDPLATTFGEVSSISKDGDRLVGRAKDPVTVRMALGEFVPAGHFAETGAAALVLGSGGAGSALSFHLGTSDDAPSRIICTALNPADLYHLRLLHERGGVDPARVEYLATADPRELDRVLAGLPAESLVVNATGMGKDRPGSPLSDDAVLPERGIVWEFNYRGSLEFLAQARAQAAARELRVHDGWRYFIHGWTQVIADVFHVPMPPETVDRLASAATKLR